MVHFECDYTRGAHPEVLGGLARCASEAFPGYGLDKECDRARRLILEECGLASDGEVYFMTGGTQTNAVVIDALVRYHQGVVCASSGHIAVHEAGAVEACGHKVVALPSDDGKLAAGDLDRFIDDFYADDTYQHCVAPGMVYISHPTELGSLYSLEELSALSCVCRKRGIPLYLDGARLVYGLAAEDSDVTLADIGRLCDVFYIGGTKAGMLFGEAVVTGRPGLLPQFFSQMKRRGAVLAKGWLLGVQFGALFADGLYVRIGRHAVRMAMKLREGLLAEGIREAWSSSTNQQFFIFPNVLLDHIASEVGFSVWGRRGVQETVVRFVTDWSTTEEDVDRLLAIVRV